MIIMGGADMREVKKPEVRQAEIIAMAERLFSEKGYLHTTTQDIISALSISRGLLYYHFKSKEEILFSIAEKHADPLFNRIHKIVEDDTLSAIEKIIRFLDATVAIDLSDEDMTKEKIEMLESIQDAIQLPENTFMMDSINHRIAYKVSREFHKIIRQGNNEGTLNVKYSEQVANFLITGFTFVMNDPYYHNNDKIKAYEHFDGFKMMLSKLLDIDKKILK